jgi:hypothetical protein
LLATAAFRGTTLAALSSAVDNLADLRQQTYAAYRANLGTAGEDPPANFSEVVEAVIAFADVLASEASNRTRDAIAALPNSAVPAYTETRNDPLGSCSM